jgi:hypothetical protein
MAAISIAFNAQCIGRFNDNRVSKANRTPKDINLTTEGQGNLRLKVLMVTKPCIMAMTKCVRRLVIAAPKAPYRGMKIKFNTIFTTPPVSAIRFKCTRLPLAVSRVPKMYDTDENTKQPISMAKIKADSPVLLTYSKSIIGCL